MQDLIFHDDLKAMTRVLGRLGYLDEEGVVTLKASSGLCFCSFLFYNFLLLGFLDGGGDPQGERAASLLFFVSLLLMPLLLCCRAAMGS